MKTVLIVEDNPQNLRLVELVLKTGGYRVLTAADGQAGLDEARTSQPALVVMDVQMPVLDGLSATRALKADPSTATIKVLALSALAMKGDAERIRAAGCDDYLAKPFDYRELLAAVSRLIDA